MFQAVEIRKREQAQARLLKEVEHEPISAVLSISDPNASPPDGFAQFSGPKLALNFADVEVEGEWLWESRPTKEHVLRIIQFAEDNRSTENMLIHCNAGESRSTAAAFVVQCVWWEPGKEDLALQAVGRGMRGTVMNPNLLITELADSILKRDGRMIRQVEWVRDGLRGMYK